MTKLQGTISVERDTGTFRVMVGRYAPSTRIERHRHENASICLALSGAYDEQVDGGRRRVEVGTLVMHPEGEAHENDHAPVVTDLLTIEFSPNASFLAWQISPVFRESWHRAATSLLPSAYRLIREVEEVQDGGVLAIDDLVWLMIADASPCAMESSCPTWLVSVRDYLEAYFATPPSLTFLAEMAGVHPAHLTRAFRKAFGSSIGEFVHHRQAAAALTMLPRSDLGLAEISAATGYADQSHMTRRISALTGRPRARGDVAPGHAKWCFDHSRQRSPPRSGSSDEEPSIPRHHPIRVHPTSGTRPARRRYIVHPMPAPSSFAKLRWGCGHTHHDAGKAGRFDGPLD